MSGQTELTFSSTSHLPFILLTSRPSLIDLLPIPLFHLPAAIYLLKELELSCQIAVTLVDIKYVRSSELLSKYRMPNDLRFVFNLPSIISGQV